MASRSFSAAARLAATALLGTIGDQRDAFAGLNRETGFNGIARAEEQLWLCGSKIHPVIVNRVGQFCYWIESMVHYVNCFASGVRRNENRLNSVAIVAPEANRIS